MTTADLGFEAFYAALRQSARAGCIRNAVVHWGLTGAVHAGKTTAARTWISALRARGVKCCGVLERARIVNGEYIGYDIEDISTSETRILARKNEYNLKPAKHFECHDIDCRRAGRYAFDRASLLWGSRCIEEAHCGSVVFVDEMGRLERMGEGLARAAQSAVARRDIIGVVWVLRQDSVSHWQSLYPDLRLSFVRLRCSGREKMRPAGME